MAPDIFDNLRDADGKPLERNIRIAAALLGPGYHGERAEFDGEKRRDIAKRLREAWEEANLGAMPGFISDEAPQWKDRRAKLFEIGEYDDKGLSVSQPDLHSLAANFDMPVPILVEHVEHPLRLGYLTHVEAAGPELFGILALTPEADELVEKSEAKALSLSVSKDLDKIFEVSIVANPRIESARLFCKDFRTNAKDDKWRDEAIRLQKQIEEQRIEATIADLLKTGVLAPSAKEQATALLTAATKKGIETEIVQFLKALPKQVQFGELVPVQLEPPSVETEEAEFYRRHFPEIGIDEIIKRKVKA